MRYKPDIVGSSVDWVLFDTHIDWKIFTQQLFTKNKLNNEAPVNNGIYWVNILEGQ